jgi:hypothetical protein
MNITFKTAELFYILSCYLFTTNNTGIASLFFSLGIIASITRFSLEQNEKLENEKRKKEFNNDLEKHVNTINTCSLAMKNNISSTH